MAGIAQAVQADAAFGTDLYLKLAAPGSVVFSPASIAAALRMALAGARGDTAGELAAVLHLPGPEAAADGLKQLAGIRPGDGLTFRAPNIMWLESAETVRDDFLAQLAETVAVERCDFARAPEAARQLINDAVAEQTAGKITGLIPPGVIDGLTRLVLTNAVYLKALWTHQFPAKDTTQKPFYPERLGPAPVDMMHLATDLTYHRGDGYQAVVLPYRGGRLAMAVVLPDGPPATLRRPIAAGGLPGLLAGASRHEVTLSMPRFRLEAGLDLIPVLRRLGVEQAFTRQADFSGITEAERLLINAVAHKAYVDVDEQGTEAAAATAIAFRPTAAFRAATPVTMTVDRPFVFAIIHTRTGLPLFIGQVRHPRPR